MTIEEYMKSVQRSTKSCDTTELDGATLDLLHWTIGLSGESGELLDAVKKYVFYKQPADIPNMIEELGDILFYSFALCETLGVTPEYVMATNRDKLLKRYPDGYSNEDAKARFDKQVNEYLEEIPV